MTKVSKFVFETLRQDGEFSLHRAGRQDMLACLLVSGPLGRLGVLAECRHCVRHLLTPSTDEAIIAQRNFKG